MFCIKCGQSLPTEAEFCIKCGHDLRKAKEGTRKIQGEASTREALSPRVAPSVPPPIPQPQQIKVEAPSQRPDRVTPFSDDVRENQQKLTFGSVMLGSVGMLVLTFLMVACVHFIFPDSATEEEIHLDTTGISEIPATPTENSSVVATPDQVDPEELYGDTLAMVRASADDQTLDFDDYVQIGLAHFLGFSDDNLSRMGYDFVDVNGDNTPELFIGYAMNDGYEYTIIGSYTVKNGDIVPYLECGERFGYFLTKDLLFGHWGWGGAGDNSFALLKMNNQGELDYESYINNLYEFDLEKEFDYIISIENNQPNYENRRIATEAELAEFYEIYDGEEYQFNYTPFIDGTETVEPVSQNFAGQAYIDFPDFMSHDEPDPSNPSFGEVYLHGMSDMKSLCYYLGLNFEYVVEDGELLIGHPDCIYTFYFGNIVDPTMKEGDILRMDGSEIVLDIFVLTEDAEKRMEAYENPPTTLLTLEETQRTLENWLNTRPVPDNTYIVWGSILELMGEGMVYSPYVGYEVCFGYDERYIIYVNRYYGNMYIELNGNYENDLDTWYAQRFG